MIVEDGEGCMPQEDNAIPEKPWLRYWDFL